MKALSIDAATCKVKEVELSLTANTVYSFFSSILIDELTTLKEHVIYTDANALSERKRAYFLGEQLVIGDALVFGMSGMSEVDVKITQEELTSLIKTEVNDFYRTVLDILADTDINLYRTFEVEKNGERIALNTEWVLYTFNIADERTKEYFINELKKELALEGNVGKYMQTYVQIHNYCECKKPANLSAFVLNVCALHVHDIVKYKKINYANIYIYIYITLHLKTKNNKAIIFKRSSNINKT